MLETYGELAKSQFINLFRQTSEVFRELYSYNHSDSPAYSQIGSIIVSIEYEMNQNASASFTNLYKITSHPTQYLNEINATSGDWDGAPIHLVEKARYYWKHFMKLVRVLNESE
jgi:hypothetical protein